jgi:hypothetical protein
MEGDFLKICCGFAMLGGEMAAVLATQFSEEIAPAIHEASPPITASPRIHPQFS